MRGATELMFSLNSFSAPILCEIVDRLQAKGVAVRILNMNLDTNDATGKLMLQIGSIAEFERSIMFSRQLEGIAKPLYPVGGAVA
jgi:DNA invertase Pin-like site-specific DNA recombinase